MIHGERESAYSQTIDEFGNKVERVMMQCVHCQFMWEYKRGSGRERGYCYKHSGLLCGRPECIFEQRAKQKLAKERNLLVSDAMECVSVEDENYAILLYVEKYHILPGDKSGTRYEVTIDGKIVPEGTVTVPPDYQTTTGGILYKK